MKKILFILIIIPILLTAQTNEIKHSVNWKTTLLYESNSLDKSFLNTIIYGGYITDKVKDNWINSGGNNNNNILYSEISNSLSYIYEKNSNIFGFSFADKNIMNARFSDDLLRIGLEGNFHHQDKTLNFSETNIRADRFQQYTFTYGISTKQVKANTSISYLSGNHHLSYIIEKGSVYTAPFGSSLNINYDMNAFITDTSSLSPFKHNGNGLAIGLSTEFKFQEYTIHFSFSDLGFIMWDPNSITLSNDSSFSFSGIEVEDIFTFNDSLLGVSNINNDVFKTRNESFKSYIPATFHFKFSGYKNYKKLEKYTLGIQGKWQPYLDNTPLSFKKIAQGLKESNFIPLYYIQSNYKGKYFDITPTLSHGGYSSNTNLGLELSKGEKNNFTIGTHHLNNVFISKNAKSLSIYINIKLQF